MTGGEIAVIITAVAGFAGGVFAAARSLGSGRTENVSVIITAYATIVDDLQEELERYQAKVAQLETSVQKLEIAPGSWSTC